MFLNVSPLVIAMSVSFTGGPVKDVQTLLQSKYDSLSKAFAAKDASTYEKMLAPNYVLIVPGGRKMERKSIVADYKRQMDMMSNVSWKRSVGKPTLTGSNAVVIVKGRFKGSFGPETNRKVFELEASSKDTWSKKGSDWLLVRSEVLSMTPLIDGKQAGRG